MSIFQNLSPWEIFSSNHLQLKIKVARSLRIHPVLSACELCASRRDSKLDFDQCCRLGSMPATISGIKRASSFGPARSPRQPLCDAAVTPLDTFPPRPDRCLSCSNCEEAAKRRPRRPVRSTRQGGRSEESNGAGENPRNKTKPTNQQKKNNRHTHHTQKRALAVPGGPLVLGTLFLSFVVFISLS